MPTIMEFGRKITKRDLTIPDLQALKGTGTRLTMCNPASVTEFQACVEAGIDVLTVWDNQVKESREVAPHTFMGTGITWDQHATPEEILRKAVKCMGEGADMFYTLRSFDVVEMLAKEGIPVQGHMGLLPTYSIWCGGLRAFGRTAEEAMELYKTFKRYEDAGAMSVEIECVAEDALNLMNDKTSIITFSLGSGNAGDVIFLFMTDICGEAPIKPKHAHTFRDLQPLHDQIYAQRVGALQDFGKEVKAKAFPYKANSVFMHENEQAKFAEMLDKVT